MFDHWVIWKSFNELFYLSWDHFASELQNSRNREVFEVFAWWGTPRVSAGWSCIQVQSSHTSDTCKVNLWLLLIWALSHTFHSTIPLYTAADQSENRAPFMQEHHRHTSDITSYIPHTTLEHRVNVTAAFLRWQKKLQNNVIQCNTPKHITCRFHGITAVSFFFFSPELKGFGFFWDFTSCVPSAVKFSQ